LGELCHIVEAAVNDRTVLILKAVQYQGVRLILHEGDITAQRTDAIVNPANSLLVMGGGVAGAIRSVGGQAIEDEAVGKGPLEIGRAIETGAGRLPARFVIHAPTVRRPAQATDVEAIRAATMAALKKAFDLGLSSVALPCMGTGVGGVDPTDAANSMVQAITDHVGAGTSLTEIRLIAYGNELLEAFDAAISRIIGSQSSM
jgi:O-acetyl-ADP-ribose deacetylase (regulator of RNase III)